MGSSALLLAFIWGVGWALFLEFVPVGRFLAARRTWLAVVIGIGVDVGLLFGVLEREAWLWVVGVVSASGVGIVGRSLWHEHNENQVLLERGAEKRESDRRSA